MGAQSYYAALGPELIHVRVGADDSTLQRHGSVRLPGRLQYGWWHPRLPLLYAACTTRQPGEGGGQSVIVTVPVDPATGDPQPPGPSVELPSRPIHVTCDPAGRHLLVTYNEPAGLTVHPLHDRTGAVGAHTARLELPATSYPHQVRVNPSGRWVVVVARGNSGHGPRPASPGSLHVFDFSDGELRPRQTLDLADSAGLSQFNPRHLDFHPTLPLVYVTLEAQNRVLTLEWESGRLGAPPAAATTTMLRPHGGPRQLCGTVHIHPSGRFLYCANRSDFAESAGGRNSIAVYSIDPRTGHPTLIQDEDTRGIHPRTFQIDPDGASLMVANMRSVASADTQVPPRLTLFSIAADGTIHYRRNLDFPGTEELLFWLGGPHRPSGDRDQQKRTDSHEHSSPMAPEQHPAR